MGDESTNQNWINLANVLTQCYLTFFRRILSPPYPFMNLLLHESLEGHTAPWLLLLVSFRLYNSIKVLT